jgi:hypothetical protein
LKPIGSAIQLFGALDLVADDEHEQQQEQHRAESG